MTHPALALPWAPLFTARNARSRRASSWDRSGGNRDYIKVEPGETATLLDHQGAGCVTHLYFGMVLADIVDYRDAILRCYWDDSHEPSVEVPLGDFFGVVNGRVREYQSALVAVNGGLGGASHGLNAYFPMPFTSRALITVEQRGPETLGGAAGNLWFHIDYETYEEPLPDDILRFHASYRQEKPTHPVGPVHNLSLHDNPNLEGRDNYVVLDTTGSGRMIGLVLEVENLQGNHWYGEGDDMVFVDDEVWPPSIHGTGSEEIFGGGACPTHEYAGFHTGFHLIDSVEYDGLVGMYRWYVNDPIHFSTSLRWTVEHGHANNFQNNYSSVAYWYQEPVARLPALPGREEMVPPLGDGYEDAKAELFSTARSLRNAAAEGGPLIDFLRACRAGRPFFRGDWQATIDEVNRFRASRGEQ